MKKPTYEELEKKVTALEQTVSRVVFLEKQLNFLQAQFSQVERQLRQRQRMDSLGTLAQGVAHDFNNILSGIMAYLNLLSLTGDNFSPPQKTYLQNITNSVKRGAAITRQFQKLSGKNIPEKTDIDIYAVAREVFQLLEETTDKMIEKRLEIEKGRFFIRAESNEIHQVFMNLSTNAVQAIEEKGVQKGDFIRLSVRPCPIEGSERQYLPPGQFYHICFEDTGSGMSEQVLEKAFDPLFTTKQTLENKGQGLGLAMVHDIITKRHNGHIEVVSRVGKGTVFHLFLPKAEAPGRSSATPFTILGGTETILVVDDDLSVRESIKTALEDFGYAVLTAGDGEEGLSLFKKNHTAINAVLLDIIMPKMSGKDVLRQMLTIHPDVKVILSSGHREDQYNDPILKSAKEYLNKPFEIDKLESKLRKVLDS